MQFSRRPPRRTRRHRRNRPRRTRLARRRTLPPLTLQAQVVHLHELLLVIPMSDLEGLRKRDGVGVFAGKRLVSSAAAGSARCDLVAALEGDGLACAVLGVVFV